jgi:hypothetical protein
MLGSSAARGELPNWPAAAVVAPRPTTIVAASTQASEAASRRERRGNPVRTPGMLT